MTRSSLFRITAKAYSSSLSSALRPSLIRRCTSSLERIGLSTQSQCSFDVAASSPSACLSRKGSSLTNLPSRVQGPRFRLLSGNHRPRQQLGYPFLTKANRSRLNGNYPSSCSEIDRFHCGQFEEGWMFRVVVDSDMCGSCVRCRLLGHLFPAVVVLLPVNRIGASNH